MGASRATGARDTATSAGASVAGRRGRVRSVDRLGGHGATGADIEGGRLRTEEAVGNEAGDISPTIFAETIGMFAEYIEWRATHPSDDLMTELLNAEMAMDP